MDVSRLHCSAREWPDTGDAHRDRCSVLLGTGDPGAVARLSSGHARVGTLTSDVLDAKIVLPVWVDRMESRCSFGNLAGRAGPVGQRR